MNRNIGLLIVLCIAVSGAMFFILSWFMKRLKKIEQEKWGDKKDVN